MFSDEASAAPKLPWPILSKIRLASLSPTVVTTDILVLHFNLYPPQHSSYPPQHVCYLLSNGFISHVHCNILNFIFY